jgi:LmbE family N-acetylglucosaminyl deacetylase/glycosyltransferase involved in cell wall biosynthesis
VFTEAEAIPYEAANLRGERLLVLAPHPDDEVIGCGGLIALHLREKRAVRIVVATDGAEAGSRELREDETRRGVAHLGENAAIAFLRHPDRALSDDAAENIREELLSFRPDLILVPSPVEIHPDHIALSRIFCELIQRDETLFGELATTRVAFYEVSSTLRPNAIVDISDVAGAKYAGIAEHTSQTALRDYAAYTRGLNAYRTMTLPPGATAAEAYHVMELPSLRSMPFSEVRRRVGGPHEIETEAAVPVSVIVRTKDRPELLQEAIASIRATGYPCEIVVVNDGGAKPELDGVTLVHHEESRGRSEAGNAGVRAATNAYIAFLDDDDLYYPEHLATLARRADGPIYTDAVSAFFKPGATEAHWRLRLFSQDFDSDLLLVDNYIPLPTILLKRDTFLELGGFDKDFDLFEDWDFLIRLAQRGDFRHIAQVTCEIRHFEGGSSVVLAAPEGTDRFRAAKLQIWKKHAALVTQDVIANAFETQKRRANEVYSQLIEARGQNSLFRGEVARLEREKAGLAHDVGAYLLRLRELEGAVSVLSPLVEQRTADVVRLAQENEALRAAEAEHDGALRHARVEVDRLNGLLDMIYRSKTWKLHTMVEKMKGRG